MKEVSKPCRQLGLFDAIMIVMGGIVGAGIFANSSEVARRDLSRGLLLGVGAVVGLYLAVNLVCLRVLGPAGLDATTTPASDVMRLALGEHGAQWIAVGIAISTLGFLSQRSRLLALLIVATVCPHFERKAHRGPSRSTRGEPSAYSFFRAWRQSSSPAPGRYGQILNFEVTVEFIFFGMTAASLFILRRRQIGSDGAIYRVPGHPFTTILFVLSCAGIVGSAIVASPVNSAIALCIMLAALPVYYYWSRFRRAHS